jgi:hypothetical protein
MRSILILFSLILCLLGIVQCPAQVVVHSSARVRTTHNDGVTVAKSRYKCVGNRCELIQDNLPVVTQSLPVPIEVERPATQEPTLAEPQAEVHTKTHGAVAARPMRSVLIRPVQGVSCAVSKLRSAKPIRRVLGRLFCR